MKSDVVAIHTVIRRCDCTGLHVVMVKVCGKPPMFEPFPVPFHLRDRAAKFQDERYGPSMRVHNVQHGNKGAANKVIGYHCTVCGKRTMA